MRVLEGAVSWDAAWEMELDDFDWLHAKAVEINDKLASDVEEIKEGK